MVAYDVVIEQNGQSVTNYAQAKRACAEFGARLVLLPEVDAQNGMWRVRLAPRHAKRLESRGYLEVHKGEYKLTAEMP